MAIDLASKQKLRPQAHHGALAAARVPDSAAANPSRFTAAVKAEGFQRVATNQYQQADGSWLVREGTTIHRGVDAQVFTAAPNDVLGIPMAARKVTCAANALPQILGDTNRMAAELTKAGFAPVIPNYFAHSDGSWVALTTQGPVYGFKQRRVPGPIGTKANAATLSYTAAEAAALRSVNPNFEHGFLATAQLGFLSNPLDAAAKRSLTQAGFKETSTNFFQHADNSWLAMTPNAIDRGHAGQRFSRIPIGITRQGSGTTPTASHFGLAIADPKIASLTPAGFDKAHDTFTALGFAQTLPNVYKHKDGSFVALTANKLHFGANNTRLTKAPDPTALAAKKPTTQNIVQMAPLWGFDAKDVKGAAAELEKRGFTETRPGFFKSGSVWASVGDKKVDVGNNTQRFSSVPTVNDLAAIKPKTEHRWNAITQTRGLKVDGKLAAALKKLGFAEKAPGFFQHADSSFVAVDGNKLVRGVGSNRLTSLPPKPKDGEFPIYQRLPSRVWSWYATNTALGRLPIVWDAASAREECQRLGFIKKASGRAERWEHPDGSYVRVSPRISVGWQKWSLGQLPFNNRTSSP